LFEELFYSFEFLTCSECRCIFCIGYTVCSIYLLPVSYHNSWFTYNSCQLVLLFYLWTLQVHIL